MNDLTHTIEITIKGNYQHGQKEEARVFVAGEGDIDHMLTAFKAALMAAGYSVYLADRLMIE